MEMQVKNKIFVFFAIEKIMWKEYNENSTIYTE